METDPTPPGVLALRLITAAWPMAANGWKITPEMVGLWDRTLRRYSEADVRKAIDRLIQDFDQFPPNLPVVRRACDEAWLWRVNPNVGGPT